MEYKVHFISRDEQFACMNASPGHVVFQKRKKTYHAWCGVRTILLLGIVKRIGILSTMLPQNWPKAAGDHQQNIIVLIRKSFGYRFFQMQLLQKGNMMLSMKKSTLLYTTLFVFSINGLKQNARSLLTPVSDKDFYALLDGS